MASLPVNVSTQTNQPKRYSSITIHHSALQCCTSVPIDVLISNINHYNTREEEIRAMRTTIDELRHKNKELDIKLKRSESKRNAMCKSFELSMEDYKRIVAIKESTNSALIAEQEDFKIEVLYSADRNQDLRIEIEKKQHYIKDLQQEIRALKCNTDTAIESIKAMGANIRFLTNVTIKDLNVANTVLRAQINKHVQRELDNSELMNELLEQRVKDSNNEQMIEILMTELADRDSALTQWRRFNAT